MTTSPVREFFRGVFFENVGLKIISLVCALGFYAFIHGGERAQRTFAVPVVSLMPPPSVQRVVVKPPPSEIAVTLSGPKTQIDALTGKDLGTIQLDLRTGLESTVQIKPSMLSVPPGLTVEQIFPSEIEVRWDDIVRRKLPVQVSRTGEPASGFIVKGSVTASPESIEATGPRMVIDLIQYARAAAPYDVSGLTEGTHPRTIDLEPPPQQVSYSSEHVTASVEVIREERMVPFKNIPVEVIGDPKAVTKPPSVTVKVKGSPDVVNALQTDQIVPRVTLPSDVDLTKPGSRFLTVEVDVAGATADVDPPKVIVKW